MKKLAAEGKTIYDIAAHYNTTVQDASGINFRSFSVPGAGIEPGLIAAASASEAGVLSKPVAGNNGVFMYVVNTAAPSRLKTWRWFARGSTQTTRYAPHMKPTRPSATRKRWLTRDISSIDPNYTVVLVEAGLRPASTDL